MNHIVNESVLSYSQTAHRYATDNDMDLDRKQDQNMQDRHIIDHIFSR